MRRTPPVRSICLSLAVCGFIGTASGAADPVVLALPDKRDKALAVDFSPDGKWLAAGCQDRTVRLWDVASGKLAHEMKGHTGPVVDVAFGPASRKLATASTDRTARVWGVKGGVQLQVLDPHKGEVWRVAFEPKTGRMATGDSTGKVTLWKKGDTAKLEKDYSFDTGGEFKDNELADAVLGTGVGGMAYSPDGSRLAFGRGLDVLLCDLRADKLYRMERSAPPLTLPGAAKKDPGVGHFNAVNCVAYSPDGRLLASSGQDAVIRLWDVATRKQVRTLMGHGESTVRTVAFSPDGRYLASGSLGQFSGGKVWDVKTGREVMALNYGVNKGDPTIGLAFSPDGKRLAVGTEGAVKIWDLAGLK